MFVLLAAAGPATIRLPAAPGIPDETWHRHRARGIGSDASRGEQKLWSQYSRSLLSSMSPLLRYFVSLKIVAVDYADTKGCASKYTLVLPVPHHRQPVHLRAWSRPSFFRLFLYLRV